ncbi:MAG: major capsid protein [Clostridia bacterium]|nr:major capsid protein [Clostridia bacterium]
MARTGTFGGFAFDPEVFTTMMNEAEYWSNPILASGVVREDASIMDAIGAKGNVATLPFYTPINLFDSGMQALNNDGETNNTPVEIAGNKQTCMLIQRMKAFKAKDFTQELTGANPIDHVRNKVQNYYTQVWENEMMNIINAVLSLDAMAEHVTDLSVTDGSITDANKVNATTAIDAEEAALGDMAGGLGMIVMHSKIFAAYQKLNLVEYEKYTVGNAIRNTVELPTINGKVVLRTNVHTVDTSKPGFPVYKTYLLGEGAILGATKNNYKEPYYVDYDPETSSGVEMLYTKQGRVLHPNGFSLAVDTIAKESPTLAELGNKANWALKFNHKNVKLGLIKSNG